MEPVGWTHSSDSQIILLLEDKCSTKSDSVLQTYINGATVNYTRKKCYVYPMGNNRQTNLKGYYK